MRYRPVALCPVAAFLAIAALAAPAQAEFKVSSPIVEKGELEFEAAGSVGRDSRGKHDHELSTVSSIGYGVTEHWSTELEGEWSRDAGPNNSNRFHSTNWVNKIQIFEEGERWLDLGIKAEYGMASKSTDADSVKVGPLVRKSWGPTTTTVNFFLEKQIGANATGGADATYGAQFRYDWLKELAPAIEAYGDFGEVNRTHSANNQTHRLGPVLTGAFGMGTLGEVKYELGYLAGLTSATPQNTYKWSLEYEMIF